MAEENGFLLSVEQAVRLRPQAPAYRAADVVVLASPMYCWSVTAQEKAVLDRLFALMEAGMRAAEAGGAEAAAAEAEAGGKGCVLLMPAEEDTERMGWRDLGRVLVGGVYRAGDIAGNPALDEARELGAGLR